MGVKDGHGNRESLHQWRYPYVSYGDARALRRPLLFRSEGRVGKDRENDGWETAPPRERRNDSCPSGEANERHGRFHGRPSATKRPATRSLQNLYPERGAAIAPPSFEGGILFWWVRKPANQELSLVQRKVRSILSGKSRESPELRKE